MHPATKLLFNCTKGIKPFWSVISSFSLSGTSKSHAADATKRKAGKQFRQHRRHAAAKACCQQQKHPGQFPAQAQAEGCIQKNADIHQMSADICTIVKGCIFEWCLSEGKMDIEAAVQRMLKAYMA